jgi:hypothetical protein
MNPNTAERRKPRWVRLLIAVGVGVGLLFVATYMSLFHAFYSFDDLPILLRPLPTDEEMIANFQRHRADFERLVRIYREDLSVPNNVVGFLLPTPEIKAAMDRIHVDLVQGDRMVWIPPDPYSRDATFLKQKNSLSHLPQQRKFSGVKLSYTYGTVIRYQGDLVCKDYCYVPLIPRESGGQLVLTGSPAGGYPRVAETLNTYPPKFGQFDCLCRQIEPQWFIEMCRRK